MTLAEMRVLQLVSDSSEDTQLDFTCLDISEVFIQLTNPNTVSETPLWYLCVV